LTLAFVDTGAWIALINSRDSLHRRAQAFFRQIAPDTKLVTSNYVLAETITWLTYNRYRRGALTFWDLAGESVRRGFLNMEWVTPPVQARAWEIFKRYDDQVFSFCDCTSFALCASTKVDFVFGFDSDFRTLGFDLRP
jgi:predicted nucleic acid-binding protein